MRRLPASAPLEAAALAGFALAVTGFAAGTSSLPGIEGRVLHLRWIALAVACATALVLVAARPRLGSPGRWIYGTGGFLAALALVSAAWSPYPRLTLERGATLAVAFAAAGALGVYAVGRPHFVRALFGTLVGLASVYAVAGLVRAAVDPDAAIQRATENSPARLHGIGMNPNTGALLYALALPLAVWLAFEAGSRLARALAGVSAAVVVISLFASGSRGATLASFIGVVLVALLRGGSWSRRSALVTATVVVYAIGVVAADLRSLEPEFAAAVQPRPLTPPAPSTGGPTPAVEPEEGEELAPGIVLPEVGPVETRWRRAFPEVRLTFPYDVYSVGFERPAPLFQPAQTGLFKGSGRLHVWEGAFREAVKRPLLGFGFGLEEQVFTDRYYAFEGARPENSYLGWLLQLGAVGTALFVAIGVGVLRLLFRAPVSGELAAAAAAVAAGFAVSLMQSWVYSVGNIATLAFWTLVAVAAASAVAATRDAVVPVAARLRRQRAEEAVPG